MAARALFKPCIIIPVYDHGEAISTVLKQLKPLAIEYSLTCWLIDDGSGPDCAEVLDAWRQAEPNWVQLQRIAVNSGKGAAMLTGFKAAADAGFTHALQVDADGQHDIQDVSRMLEQARQAPEAVIAGVPIYDDSVPKARLYGRYITHFWVWVNTASFAIQDSMCGFRVYPLAATNKLIIEEAIGRRMDFDTDIIVRLYWRGVPVINQPTRVHYPLDGVSHFEMWHDNFRITLMHSRLFFTMLFRRLVGRIQVPQTLPSSRKN